MAKYLARSCPRCNGYVGIIHARSGPQRTAAGGQRPLFGLRLSHVVDCGLEAESHGLLLEIAPPCDPVPKKVPDGIRRRVEIARKSSARRFPSAIANRFLVTTDIVTRFARHLTNSLVL